MTHSLVWLYVTLAITSGFLIFVWGHVAACFIRERTDEGKTLTSLAWSKSFLVAGGLTVHSIAMFLATSYRVYDLYRRTGSAIAGDEPYILTLFLAMIVVSNVVLIWAASTDEARKKVRWPWVAYVWLMIAVTILVLLGVDV